MWKSTGMKLRMTILLLLITGLTACLEEDNTPMAPVVEGPWHSTYTIPNQYRVRHGDTLYSIAFRYDQDYRRLAALNHLESPYVVKVGQIIALKPVIYSAASTRRYQHVVRPQPKPWVARAAVVPPSLAKNTHWQWPTRGRVVSGFAPSLGKKGIDIAGSKGQTIRATASGTVAYAGDGLPGYGNMILIQHPHQLLSAYGYNAQNLVHAGQAVRAGQPIAIMGTSPQHRYATHFEVRKAGKPVNPSYFLH